MSVLLLLLQAIATTPAATARHPADAAASSALRATHTATAPVIDGIDDDPVWRSAEFVDDFREARPTEGGAARVRTAASVAYDARNLYVFVRAFDPHPDSIVSLLARRDEMPPSDRITVMIDSYHDRRTGYEFSVNPAGVKADEAIYDDSNEDEAWNAVWDVAARMDSLGWTAEYRIPLSQLRYSTDGDGTFGILIWRFVQRYTEDITWPLHRMSRSGLVSQFGQLTGLDGLASPGRAEITPYLVTKNVEHPTSAGYERQQEVTAGGDLSYRIASNLMLNATVNPDFGQVEADPSELNLSAFETFFTERRPFFVEGKGLFEFRVNCVVVLDCNTGEGLFYSRRIGRAPQLADLYGNDSSPASTTILGAAKLTGRFSNGFSLGVLDAVTGRVRGAEQTTQEPATNYAVVRGKQDFDAGRGSLGFILTGVNRRLDASSESYLHESAYAAGLDARRRFAGELELSASFDYSRVAGSRAAIARTQRNPVHLYQRPDDDLAFDSTRTSLDGTSLELRFAKVGGRRLQFETAYQRRTPGFEINDIGFLLQADQQEWTSWASLAFRTPNRIFRQLQWNFNNWEYWSATGLPTERAFNTNVHTQFVNRWWLHMGGTIGQLGTTWCDRCARGGPAIRQDPYFAPWIGIQGDDRKVIVPSMFVNYNRSDQGRSRRISLQPELDIKISSSFTTSISANLAHNDVDLQYYGTFTDSASSPHYTFAHLDQRTVSLTWRLGYTFTPDASLQIYASPFLSKGGYSDVRELSAPRAVDYDARFRPYGDVAIRDDPGGFDVGQFRSNVVFRWEYHPGSTLFLVWSQGRQGSEPFEQRGSLGGDLSDLFDRRADDVFLVKLSYWFAR